MDLVDIVSQGTSLLQDEWSLSERTFGGHGQVSLIGWSGRSNIKNSGAKYYILKCSVCSQDHELFGEGVFRSVKGSLISGALPCGCAFNPKWSQEQFYTICTRKAKELTYVFSGFVGEWKGRKTKIKMLCIKHGEWSSGTISNLISRGAGCPLCRSDTVAATNSITKTKPIDTMVVSFLASNSFHPDTKFWRSERLNSYGRTVYWHMFCPECGEGGEGLSSDLQKGQRPCACNNQRQQECYINWVNDGDNCIAIKFGIARDSKQRVKQQNRQSVYSIKQHQVYNFPTVASCKAAERECKKTLECGILTKGEMEDGFTETTWPYNIEKIIGIYLRNSGELKL